MSIQQSESIEEAATIVADISDGTSAAKTNAYTNSSVDNCLVAQKSLEHGGQNLPNKLHGIRNDSIAIENSISVRKSSLTLPLVNVIGTDMANDHAMPMVMVAHSEDQPLSLTERRQATSKMKQIYESDDMFIQTIFAQTIKSTTATPTDDEFSPEFDLIPHNRTAVQSHATETAPPNVSEFALSSISDEPIAAFTYFHQTIEADDPPSDLSESITGAHNISIEAAATPSADIDHATDNIDNIDANNSSPQSACTHNTTNNNNFPNAEHPDISSRTNTISPSESFGADSFDSDTDSLDSSTLNVSNFVMSIHLLKVYRSTPLTCAPLFPLPSNRKQ